MYVYICIYMGMLHVLHVFYDWLMRHSRYQGTIFQTDQGIRTPIGEAVNQRGTTALHGVLLLAGSKGEAFPKVKRFLVYKPIN